MWRESPSPTSAWWWRRWKRAAPPASTTRPPTATRCTPARRAPIRCATRRRRCMGVPNEKLRVITEDVGGAFGMKTPVYPEYIAVLVGAKKLGRPVHWSRRARRPSSPIRQARDTVTDVELALDDKGKFLALRVRHLCNQGAYVSTAGIGINTNNFARCLPGMYDIPKIDVGVACYFSNTVADRPLSRRRTPGGELRAGTRGRGSRARSPKHGPGAAAQEEFDSGLGHAVQDADQRPMTAATSPASSTRRSSSPTTTTSPSASARRTSARSCAASASPACSSMPARCRWKPRRSAFPAARR